MRHVVHTRQPRLPSGLNYSNPLVRGIKFVAIGGIPFNFYNNLPGTLVGSITLSAGPHGRTFKTTLSNSNRVDFTNGIIETISNEHSYGSIFIHDGTSSALQYLILKDIGTNTNLFTINGTDKLQISFGASGNSQSTSAIAINTWTIGSGSTPPSGVSTYTSANLWINGTQNAIATGSNSVPAGGVDGNAVYLNGRPADNLRQLGGEQALSVIWNRVLSNMEHAAFHRNPWQLFNDYYRPMFNDATVSTFNPAWAVNSTVTIQSRMAA